MSSVAVKSKEAILEFISLAISVETLPSIAQKFGDRWQTIGADDLALPSEKLLIKRVEELYGFEPNSKLLLVDTERGQVYGPTICLSEGQLVVRAGREQKLLTWDEGLLCGKAKGKPAVVDREVYENGETKKIQVPVVTFSLQVGDAIWKQSCTVSFNEGANPDLIEALLEDGNFDALVKSGAIKERGAPGKGGGGLYPNLTELSKSFAYSGVAKLPVLNLPVLKIEPRMVEFERQGKKQTIRSILVTIDPDYLPQESLIRWKVDGESSLYRITKPKGFEISSRTGPYSQYSNAEMQAVLEAAIAKGTCGLAIRAYGSKTEGSPISCFLTDCHYQDFQSDYSGIDVSNYPPLPGKNEPATSSDSEVKNPPVTEKEKTKLPATPSANVVYDEIPF